MSNELNLTKEEAITEKPEVSGGGNKIVPITNAVVDPAANNTAVNNSSVNNSAANNPVASNPVASNPVAADTATVSNHSADAVDSVITSDSSAATAINSVSADLTQVSASTDDSAAADFADAAVNTNSSAAANFISAAANTNSSADGFTDHSTVSTADASAAHDTVREKATSYRQPKRRAESSKYYDEDQDEDFHFTDEERPKKPFFRFRSVDEEESRDKLILSRIKDEDLMEYLALEQRRLEFLQQAKETKQKRLLTAFQLLISLAAIVAVTYLLQDNPTILISILYIVGIVAALNIWKNPHDKGKWRK